MNKANELPAPIEVMHTTAPIIIPMTIVIGAFR